MGEQSLKTPEPEAKEQPLGPGADAEGLGESAPPLEDSGPSGASTPPPRPGRQPDHYQQRKLNNDFSYHPTSVDNTADYENIRANAKSFAYLAYSVCPQSRELSLAITKIEEAVMWANAAIARNPADRSEELPPVTAPPRTDKTPCA